MVDTHTHLYSDKFSGDREAMIERARAAGVERALLPAIDSSTHDAMFALEEVYPDFCHAMIGLHPVSVGEDYESQLEVVASYLRQRPFIALGEIGMDLHWDVTYRREQEIAFERQCGWAVDYALPISIHARKSIPELLEMLEGMERRPRGVFHCFTGTAEEAKRAIDLGFFLGIGGVATFKNGGLEPVLRSAPRERIILETDAPYLAPKPHRGKRNETAYLPLIAARVAELWGTSVAEVGKVTSKNAGQLFDLDRFATPEQIKILFC